MVDGNVKKMKSKCRLCGEIKSLLVDMFGEEGRKLLVYMKVKANINIHLSENDPFPKSVCMLCLAKLDSIGEFQEICRRAQLVFRKDFEEECVKRCLQEIKKLDDFKDHSSDNELYSTAFKEHWNEPVVQFEYVQCSSLDTFTPNDSKSQRRKSRCGNHYSKDALQTCTVAQQYTQSDPLQTATSVKDRNSLLFAILETKSIVEDKQLTRAASVNLTLAAEHSSSKAHIEILAVDENQAVVQSNGLPDVPTPVQSELSDPQTFLPLLDGVVVQTPNGISNSQTVFSCLTTTPQLSSDGTFVSSLKDIPAVKSGMSASSPVRDVSDIQSVDSEPNIEEVHSDLDSINGLDNAVVIEEENSDVNGTRCVYPETLKAYLERSLHFMKSASSAELAALPNRCPLCNRGTSRATLHGHFEMHLNRICNVCGKAFAERNQFVFHEASHVNARLFACSKCDKKFNQRKNLSNHNRVVHKPESYFCEDCGKGYGRKAKLFVHLEVVHGRKYECHMCDTMYSNQSSLLEHQSNKHKMASPVNFSEKHLSLTVPIVASPSDGTTHTCTVLQLERDPASNVTIFNSDRDLYSRWNSIGINDQDNSNVNDTRCDYPETLKAYLERSLQVMKNSTQAELDALPNHCSLCNIYRGTTHDLLRSHLERHLKHYCNVCSKTFAKKKSFVFHQESHVNERRFLCSKCDKKFNQLRSLSEHNRFIHGPERYFCEDCGKGYRRKVHLFAHLQVVHAKKYKCHMCDAMYSEQSDLIQHQSDNHKLATLINSFENHLSNSKVVYQPDFTTGACTQLAMKRDVANGVVVIKSDRTSNSGQNNFSIANLAVSGAINIICDYPETLESYLHRTLQHMKKATVAELSLLPNSCAVCTDYNAYNPRSLIRHLEQHLTFRCDQCERTFPSKKQFQYHQRTHNAESLYACPKCNKKFLQKAVLDSHIVTHEPKRFFCNDCGNGFRQKTCLTNHIRRVHYNIKNHKCHICEKTFSTIRHLADHLTRHNRTPNYMCDECGKAYYSRRHLRTHVQLMHHAEKVHKCNECDSAFKTKSQLKFHQLVHTGEKPWCCDQCGKSFARQYTLEKHIKSIHTPKTIMCPICLKTFAYEAYLTSHMDNHLKHEDCEMSVGELVDV